MRRMLSGILGVSLAMTVLQPALGATGPLADPPTQTSIGRCVDDPLDPNISYKSDAIMVKRAALADEPALIDLALEHKLREDMRLPHDTWARFKISDGTNPIDKAREVAADPRVDCAVPIPAGTLDAFPNTAPNDPRWPDQWGFQHVNMLGAWQIAGGGSSTNFIAIIDSGVDTTHPDLGYVQGKSFTGTSGIDDHCYPLLAGGHGTGVAGVAAAFTNNGKAIAGVAYNAAIRVYRITENCPDWFPDDAADAVYWAVDHGAWAINMSATGVGWTEAQVEYLHNAMIYAYNHNVPVVVAAGNHNYDRFDFPVVPSQCEQGAYLHACAVYPAKWPEVITVGGYMLNGTGQVQRWQETVNGITGGSNWGLPGLDLSAPANDIWTTKYGGGTILQEGGTSFAAPMVAGIVYLIKSRHPTWTSAQIKSRLWTTADALGGYNYSWNTNFCGPSPYQSAELGCGILDADGAVQ